MKPDLNTEEGRAAYRRELRRVAWPIRWGGLGLIVLGALLAVGWAMVLAAIFMRTQHHKRRLREGL